MKISVCLATYNGHKYIIEQLTSILDQLSDSDEIIISDDCSTDDTIRLITTFNDRRIKIYYNKQEKGYSANFENAVSLASGDIIFLCDQDDVWEESKVSIMVNELKSAYMVISDAEVVDENLTQIHPSHFLLNGTRKGFLINLLKTRYIGACMAFRREILSKALPFPTNKYLCVHDYWLALIAEFYYNVVLVHKPLVKYRRHGNNASTGGTHSPNSMLKILKTRIYVIYELIKRRNR